MCGRFTLTLSGEALAEAFGLEEVPEVGPRYNIAPSQPVLVVRRAEAGGRLAAILRWGLSPARGDEDSRGVEGAAPPDGRRTGLLINARAETVGRKPTFREAFLRRRCLVPADGFYEWKRAGRGKQPFHIRLRDGGPFAFAGIWEPPPEGRAEPGAAGSCVLLTTEPNELLLTLHDRMPVILARESYELWLGEGTPASLHRVLRPYPASALFASPVGPAVNSPETEGPGCLAPPDAGSHGPVQGRLFPEGGEG